MSFHPIVAGLYSSGRPSISLKSYFVDITFHYLPGFRGETEEAVDLSKLGHDLQLQDALRSGSARGKDE